MIAMRRLKRIFPSTLTFMRSSPSIKNWNNKQHIIKWAASCKILMVSDPLASVVPSTKRPCGTPTPAAPSPAQPSCITSESIAKLHKDGRCVCGHRDKLENCFQFLTAGYFISYDPDKAKEKLVELQGKSKKKKSLAAAAAAPTTDTLPSDPSPTVVSASHASPTNPFAALESDNEEVFLQDVGALYAAVAGNATSASALYSPASTTSSNSTCIGSSSHAAVVPVGCSSSAMGSSVVIVDCGAANIMWHDYSAFTSYSPTSSKYVLLANNTKAPVAGVGSIKILLDGRV